MAKQQRRAELIGQVSRSQDVCGNSPVFAGTRIPVELIQRMRRDGASVQQVLDAYPTLTPKDVAAADKFEPAHSMPAPMPAARAATAALAEALSTIIREAVFDAFAELMDGSRQAKPGPVLLTRAELAAALNTSPATVSRLVAEGVPRIMLLDSPRYRLADVLAWLEARTAERRSRG